MNVVNVSETVHSSRLAVGAPIFLAIEGGAGDGKTYGALELAAGFGGETILLNTEGPRAGLYRQSHAYSVKNIDPPFSFAAFHKALDDIEREGPWRNLILDSASDIHEGAGGVLDAHEAAVDDLMKRWRKKEHERDSCNMAGWNAVRRDERRLYDRLMRLPMNVIATVRLRETTKPVSEGRRTSMVRELAPVISSPMPYYFTCSFRVSGGRFVVRKPCAPVNAALEKMDVLNPSAGRAIGETLGYAVSADTKSPKKETVNEALGSAMLLDRARSEYAKAKEAGDKDAFLTWRKGLPRAEERRKVTEWAKEGKLA